MSPPEHARDEALAPAPESKPQRHWYGEQTLLVDGASIGLFFAGLESGDLALVGGLGYLLGAPIVHGAHGHAGKAFGSLGLRVGMPLAGAAIGVSAADCGNGGGDFCGLGEGLLGFGLGILGAIIVDASVIAYEDVPPAEPRVMLAPVLTPRHAGLGLSGQF